MKPRALVGLVPEEPGLGSSPCSSEFAEDADFVNVGGMRLRGQDEIELSHAEKHRTQFRESKIEIGRVDIRFLDAEVAVVHVETRIGGDRNPDRISRTPRHTVFMAVALRMIAGWRLVAFQNTNRHPHSWLLLTFALLKCRTCA
jgi:uncharacterized protein (TIGR02246 family)